MKTALAAKFDLPLNLKIDKNFHIILLHPASRINLNLRILNLLSIQISRDIIVLNTSRNIQLDIIFDNSSIQLDDLISVSILLLSIVYC